MASGKNIENFVPVVAMHGLKTDKAADFGNGITVSSGNVTLTTGNVVVSANSGGFSFAGTGTLGGVLTNLYNDTATTLGGTQRDIKILIGTVPYYWTVYPTKS